jgi:hypothetical protein
LIWIKNGKVSRRMTGRVLGMNLEVNEIDLAIAAQIVHENPRKYRYPGGEGAGHQWRARAPLVHKMLALTA